MTRRSLLILAAVTLLVVIAAILVPRYGTAGADPSVASGPVFPGFAVGSVAHLTVGAGASGGGNVTLDRTGDRWTLAEKGDYPADAAKVTALLGALGQLQYVEAKTAQAALLDRLDLSTGPDGKGRPVDAKDAADKPLARIVLGKKKTGGLGGADGIYFRLGDQTQSWLGQPAIDLPAEQTAWLDPAVPGLDPAAVRQVTILQPDRSTVTVARPAADQPFTVAALPAGTTAKAQPVLAGLGGAAAGFDFQDVAPAAAFKFPDSGATVADVTAFDGTTLRYEMIDRSGGTWARMTAGGPADKADPLNAHLKGWIFELPAPRAAALKSRLADLTDTPAKPPEPTPAGK